MDDKEKVKSRIKIKLSIMMLSFLGFLLILSGSSYAYFTTVQEQEGTNVVKAGDLELTLEDKGNLLSLSSAFPVSDEVGLTSDGYSFTIKNTGSLPAKFEIKIEKDDDLIKEDKCETNLLDFQNIKYSIDGKVVQTLNKVTENELNNVILIDSLVAGGSKDYNVKMWIDDASGNEVLGKHFHGKITISASQTEPFTEPNAPKLVDGMIPVAYDASANTWRKADTSTSWYSYANQEWANAVTVVEKTSNSATGHDRDYYLNAVPGTPINMEDINTMWVWIPRYEYNYVSIMDAKGDYTEFKDYDTASGYLKPDVIGINFISKTTTPSDSANYKIHPAFDFGGTQLEGFWYGKFETSNKEKSCTSTHDSVGTECDQDIYTPEIKPSVQSWTGIRVSTAFEVSRKMQTTNYNIYGFSNNQNNYDTHMSKNSEWGAVAYLSQSQYGKYGNNLYDEDDKEVYINNCGLTTGVAGCYDAYTSTNGLKTSTTGNITGIYDMNGGAVDYVMGILADEDGTPISGVDESNNSGFNGSLADGSKYEGGIDFPNDKYYDLYTSTNITSPSGSLSETACDGGVCYGHALSETANWYSDYYCFVRSIKPWFARGGAYTLKSYSGLFRVDIADGAAERHYTFRLVLAPIGQ